MLVYPFLCNFPKGVRDLPILSVTVMMLSDMVESVMLLNDEDCRRGLKNQF